MNSAIIPDSVTTIGESAFMFCTELNSVTYLGTKDLNNKYLFTGCTKLGKIKVPANYEGNSFCGKFVEKTLPAQNKENTALN